MGWKSDDAKTVEELRWLELMSTTKFDGYADFRAGVRFIENLAIWLQQFGSQNDRETAYQFVKNRLVYISPLELQKLIEAFVPECVLPRTRQRVANSRGVKPYEVWQDDLSAELFGIMLRRTLFVGMSDGSRIDALRRANYGRISNEQVVSSLEIDDTRWEKLGEKLCKQAWADQHEPTFDQVCIVDDFTVSGTTFLRYSDGKWKGKLITFNDNVRKARKNLEAENKEFPLAKKFKLHIHHYISSSQARETLETRVVEALKEIPEDELEFEGEPIITEGLLLPSDIKVSEARDPDMIELCKNYYNHQLFLDLEGHCKEAGQSHMRYGYADCALPVIMDHNTPNNSLSLLWHQSEKEGDIKDENGNVANHPMRPLFYRRNRHG